jgi:hypothetical protein
MYVKAAVDLRHEYRGPPGGHGPQFDYHSFTI